MPLIVRASVIPLDDGTVLLTNAITVKELLKRWPGIAEFELADLMEENTLQGYTSIVKLLDENGKVQYRCRVGGSCFRTYDEYIWHDTCFNVEDVENIESTRWYYKERRADDEYQTQQYLEWISCETLASRWGWSPFQVVELMNSGVLPFHHAYGRKDVYLGTLKEVSVHIVDLQRWEVENAHRINNAPVLEKDGELLRQEIRSLTQKIAELEAGKAALQLELEARPIIPPKPPEPPKPSRTAAASKAATEKRVEEWKRHAACMVKVAVECCVQGPRKRKRPELRTLAKKHGGELPEVALDTLRDALPEEHVSRDAGPSRQD